LIPGRDELERRARAGDLAVVDELEALLRDEPSVSWQGAAESTLGGLRITTEWVRRGERPAELVTRVEDWVEAVEVFTVSHGTSEVHARLGHLVAILDVLRGEIQRPRLL
jgi:hypothetical protein